MRERVRRPDEGTEIKKEVDDVERTTMAVLKISLVKQMKLYPGGQAPGE